MAKLSSSNGLEKRPKLRFPGFDEPWKETTLSALFSKSTQKNADGHITNVICNSAKLGLIPQRKYFDKDIANSDNTSGYYIIRQNDFVYNPRKSSDAPYGPISSYKYAEDGIVSPLYLCFHAKDEINPLYYEWYFRSSAWHRYIYMSGDSGARHDRVSIKDDTFFAMPINLPSEQEQSKIASFLQSLDERIAAQEKLVASLKKYKRGSLSALFPKKREITPQYRFAGFTKPWEQRKLGDMGSTFNGLSGKTKDDFGHGEAKFITYMNVFSNPIADLTMTESIEIDKKQKTVKAGDVFFTTSSETPDEVGMSSVMPEDADNIYLNSFCFGYRPTEKFNLNYLAYVLRADSFRKEMTFLAQGISRYNISKNKVMEVCIPVPTIEEQTKVGRYFRNLDHLITLHQHKYDILLSLKNALLQQMFI